MEIVILVDKYGNHCNRLFQSLHFHARCIEDKSIFFNISLIGNLRFDNKLFICFDYIKNILLKSINKILRIFFRKKIISFQIFKKFNFKIVGGWEFRVEDLTNKYYVDLKEIYKFKIKVSKNLDKLFKKFANLKNEGRYLVAIHIRRSDYKIWKNGIYYFDDIAYNKIIENIREELKNKNLSPFFIGVSDEKISEIINLDFKSNFSWIEDQMILNKCDLIVGPPSTFTMWASYISETPLIQISKNGSFDLLKAFICKG